MPPPDATEVAALDVVGEAVEAGLARPGRRRTSERAATAEARDLMAQARRDHAYRASLPRALALVEEHPTVEQLQIIAARLVMEAGDLAQARTSWAGVAERFPEAAEPYRMLIRIAVRMDGEDAAEALVRSRFPDIHAVVDDADLLALAAAEQELKRPAVAEDCLRKATRLNPQNPVAWRKLAELQRARGGLLSAERTLAEAAAVCPTAGLSKLHSEITRELHAIESLSPSAGAESDPDAPVSLRALRACLDLLREHHPRATPSASGVLGSTMLVTGSLGPGGAERQLVATALALEQAIERGEPVLGYEMAGPVSVAVRSLASKRENDFFLHVLESAGVRVTEYSRLEPYGGDLQRSRLRTFGPVLDLLPVRMREGVVQLVEHFRYEAPDIVHIWQDGMVFAAGLAALIAQVPRIILSARTLPPTDRVDRQRVELEPLYRLLLATPGVALTANSEIAARRYESWLGLAAGSVAVIHNGVAPPPVTPAPDDEEKWEAFAARTADANFTLGCVMRMDENKRPLEWLMAAERLHARHPQSRFVLIGGGPLMPRAQELAARLGIRDRVLFGARSASVGYWLSRMDAFMLLSRFEGTPNVLIEAQLTGVPVVTTPAGGAAETLIPGVTGHVLSSAERPDPEEITRRLLELVRAGPQGRAEMGRKAQDWASRSYSIEAMLHHTVDIFLSPMPDPVTA